MYKGFFYTRLRDAPDGEDPAAELAAEHEEKGNALSTASTDRELGTVIGGVIDRDSFKIVLAYLVEPSVDMITTAYIEQMNRMLSEAGDEIPQDIYDCFVNIKLRVEKASFKQLLESQLPTLDKPASPDELQLLTQVNQGVIEQLFFNHKMIGADLGILFDNPMRPTVDALLSCEAGQPFPHATNPWRNLPPFFKALYCSTSITELCASEMTGGGGEQNGITCLLTCACGITTLSLDLARLIAVTPAAMLASVIVCGQSLCGFIYDACDSHCGRRILDSQAEAVDQHFIDYVAYVNKLLVTGPFEQAGLALKSAVTIGDALAAYTDLVKLAFPGMPRLTEQQCAMAMGMLTATSSRGLLGSAPGATSATRLGYEEIKKGPTPQTMQP